MNMSFNSGLSAFIDAIYNNYHKVLPVVEEEDQKLPIREVMEEVCQTLLDISCTREEGRFPTFRVCFIHSDSDLLSAYIYAHPLLFTKPVGFNNREIHKLAPALNADMSYLMLDIRERPFKATGIIAAYTTWEKIVTGELVSGNRMPRIPNILVSGPGELKACFGETSLVNYVSGSCIFTRTDTFISTWVSEQLLGETRIPVAEYRQLIYRVLWLMVNYRHGGTVLIVPSEESCAKYIDIKYQLPTCFLFNDNKRLVKLSSKMRAKDIVTYADMIAKLTCVDGSVVLTKDLDLIGFGAETLVDKMQRRQPDVRFIGYDGEEETSKQFKDYGMRHRAGYRFCDAVKGSVAIIVSQDGSIECCTEHDGVVYVYENVALPLY